MLHKLLFETPDWYQRRDAKARECNYLIPELPVVTSKFVESICLAEYVIRNADQHSKVVDDGNHPYVSIEREVLQDLLALQIVGRIAFLAILFKNKRYSLAYHYRTIAELQEVVERQTGLKSLDYLLIYGYLKSQMWGGSTCKTFAILFAKETGVTYVNNEAAPMAVSADQDRVGLGVFLNYCLKHRIRGDGSDSTAVAVDVLLAGLIERRLPVVEVPTAKAAIPVPTESELVAQFRLLHQINKALAVDDPNIEFVKEFIKSKFQGKALVECSLAELQDLEQIIKIAQA